MKHASNRSLLSGWLPAAVRLSLMLSLVWLLGFVPPAYLAAADKQLAHEAGERLFLRTVEPLFIQKCGGCHGISAKELKGGYDMRSRAALLQGGESGDVAVVPGKPSESPLLQAIRWQGGNDMPPKENDRLSAKQIAAVQDWIAAEAPWPDAARRKHLMATDIVSCVGVRLYTIGGSSAAWTQRLYKAEDLWAYQPLRNDASDVLKGSDKNPIDVFIDKQLAAKSLTPLPSANRRTLYRRLSYDLTGLAPQASGMQAFLEDKSEDAWNKAIDRLLASPRYGEQWARHWLDVVRYADSSGFANDYLRANAWRYRDYVIRAFNNDKPYDEFMREQIAGDEIYDQLASEGEELEAKADLLIAPGFLRSGPWEHTGMSVAAVTRQQYLDDVTNSVGVTFLGHELRCASCHDHKFDPLPTKDYYSMQAIFAPVQFVDRSVPFQPYENTSHFDTRQQRVQLQIAAGGVKGLRTIPRDKWPVAKFDADTEGKGHAKVNRKRTAALQRELKRFKPLAFSVYSGPQRLHKSSQVITPLPPAGGRQGKAQEVSILKGGSIETPGEPVTAGLLSVVTSDDLPAIMPQSLHGRRIALANWLADVDNPLPARVIVNRIWQYHFGAGLAGNPNNFGATGKKPTHPALLDFLAGYLIDNGWSIKKLHRLILTSKAWQRASGPASSAAIEKDPDNAMYARFSPRRLTAEELRDSMLQVSGELNLKMGGLPVRPEMNMEVAMQPRHVMGSVAPAYQPSPTPEQRNRRTIYVERIRTLRDPLLQVFNQPGLDTSCERRDSSTITPQAFTLLNSGNSLNRAIACAARIAKTNQKSNARIEQVFAAVYGRQPSGAELQACMLHYQKMLSIHQNSKPKADNPPDYVVREMVEEMTGLRFFWVEDLDIYRNYTPGLQASDVEPDVRALADVCLVLLNSNEFVYVY